MLQLELTLELSLSILVLSSQLLWWAWASCYQTHCEPGQVDPEPFDPIYSSEKGETLSPLPHPSTLRGTAITGTVDWAVKYGACIQPTPGMVSPNHMFQRVHKRVRHGGRFLALKTSTEIGRTTTCLLFLVSQRFQVLYLDFHIDRKNYNLFGLYCFTKIPRFVPWLQGSCLEFHSLEIPVQRGRGPKLG